MSTDVDPENTVAPRPLQRIKNSYQNAVIPEKDNIALFSDSIPREMNIKEIRAHVNTFSGAKSTQVNHYVSPTLQEYNYAAFIHVGINDMLRSKHYDKLDKLTGNIIRVGNTCQKYNIGKIFI